jgi:hypothetical protein
MDRLILKAIIVLEKEAPALTAMVNYIHGAISVEIYNVF